MGPTKKAEKVSPAQPLSRKLPAVCALLLAPQVHSFRNSVFWLGKRPRLSAHIEDRGTGLCRWADSFHFFQILSSGEFSNSSCLYALKRDLREKTGGQFGSPSRSLYNGG